MAPLNERLRNAGLSPEAIREVAERHGATRVRVFGSFDLLVELKPGRGLLDMFAGSPGTPRRRGHGTIPQSILPRRRLWGGGGYLKADRAYLQHIRDAITKIELYTAVGKEEFLARTHWQDAIVRQLEIIGEASESAGCVMSSFITIWA